ncbi:lipoprotein [Streptomyces sp. enrichment culture]|uniref:lipoprotein n=1 Tax=Streptomyces sp. enrichment culture TaxID=1795815 RepID=UPI003F55320E
MRTRDAVRDTDRGTVPGTGRGAVRGTGRGAVRGAAVAVAAAALLAGCGGTEPAGTKAGAAPGSAATGSPAAPSAAASPSPAASASPAAKGGTVGAAGSACPLPVPVTFDTAADWEPKKVKPVTDPDLKELNELLEQGTLTLGCEIDAKPAGHLGFLKVWTDDAGDTTPRAVLESFVADDDSPAKPVYRDVRVGEGGTLAATEVTYLVTSALLDEQKQVRALAVMTPHGPLVLELGGMDTEEHEAMLPAYELAKATLAVTAD